ncbi:MAG TPA: hypothetical protein VGM05_29310 [Planctomycetaceae bacterium]|jgi:hypothetical protein
MPNGNRRNYRGGGAWRWIWQFGAAALLLAGCGADTYEERLKNTRAMFAHQEQLNANLTGAWGDQETGVSLRVPLQFVMLPPPVKPAPDPAAEAAKAAAKKKGEKVEEEEEVELIDDRQPSYMNLGLPGLRGAFRAPLNAIGDNNALIEGDGFLYVLTNHHLADQADQAKEFEKQVIQTLSEALHKIVEPSDWKDDHFPPDAKAKASFVKSVPYKNVTLTSDEEIAGYFREFTAYLYEQGDIQVVVLIVLPKDVEPSAKLAERIPLCLETLVVSGNRLIAPSAGGAAVGAPPAGAF